MTTYKGFDGKCRICANFADGPLFAKVKPQRRLGLNLQTADSEVPVR